LLLLTVVLAGEFSENIGIVQAVEYDWLKAFSLNDCSTTRSCKSRDVRLGHCYNVIAEEGI
jgi:hypothetical protein